MGHRREAKPRLLVPLQRWLGSVALGTYERFLGEGDGRLSAAVYVGRRQPRAPGCRGALRPRGRKGQRRELVRQRAVPRDAEGRASWDPLDHRVLLTKRKAGRG